MSTAIRSSIKEMLCSFTEPSPKAYKSKKTTPFPTEAVASSLLKIETVIEETNLKIEAVLHQNNTLSERVIEIETQMSEKIKKIKTSFLTLKEKNSQLEERIKLLEQEKIQLKEIEAQSMQRKKALRSALKGLQAQNIKLEERVAQIESLIFPQPAAAKSSLDLIEEATEDSFDEEFIFVKDAEIEGK